MAIENRNDRIISDLYCISFLSRVAFDCTLEEDDHGLAVFKETACVARRFHSDAKDLIRLYLHDLDVTAKGMSDEDVEELVSTGGFSSIVGLLFYPADKCESTELPRLLEFAKDFKEKLDATAE